MEARDRFRQGFIMLKRPFDFHELKNPLQQFTILWAYSERPIEREVLNEAGKEKVEEITNRAKGPWSMRRTILGGEAELDEYIAREVDVITSNKMYLTKEYEGQVVQAYVDGHMCRFYPDEYSIVGPDKLTEILAEDGYHAIISPGLEKQQEFIDKRHYLQSRGVSKRVAEKWASSSFGEMVIFKPYFELLRLFVRPQHIYTDDTYVELEDLSIDEQKKLIGI